MIHSKIQQFKSKYAKTMAFTLTEVLLATALVGVVSMLAVSALNVSGQIQAIQANKVVQSAMMEIQAAFTKYKQRNGMIDESTPWVAFFDNIDGTLITTPLVLDHHNPTSPTVTCNHLGNVRCIRLKSGAVVMYWHQTSLLWGQTNIFVPRNIRVRGIIIDPDGVDSSPTNDAGQPVKLLFTMQGHFLTSTNAQWDQVINPVTNIAEWADIEQPRYFRLDK